MTAKHTARVLKLELEAVQKLAKAFDTPRALTVSLLVKYGEWDQLLDLTTNPNYYDNAGDFATDYQITSILQKNPRLPVTHNRREVALRKFYAAEHRCAETNARIREFYATNGFHSSDDTRLILRIQHIIQKILSAYPSAYDLRFAEQNMSFGPGATTSCSGVVTQGSKYKHRVLDCTPPLVHFRAFCFPDLWKQNVCDLNIRNYSKLTTVPKNAKTDRVICIEPDLNIFVQKGVGALLREKLKRFGLDLNTQENNQRMARRAHRDHLSTVDLAAASDTISYEVVQLLLPPAWVELLEFSRCPSTEVDGKVIGLEKWSSMGNGYTFELETLIFYATALAVTPEDQWHDTITYGDDIILPTEYFPLLSEALDLLGFEVNTEKTFGYGRFHESCGTDWFDGQNVRPFYLRSTSHDFPSICYLYANNARRWANRRNGGWSCDARCLPFWLCCYHAVKPNDAYLIPEGFGDVGFVTDFDRAAPTVINASRGWQGYRFFYRKIRAVEVVIDHLGCLLAFLNGTITDFSSAKESLRGRFRPAVKAAGTSFDWPDLGPWL